MKEWFKLSNHRDSRQVEESIIFQFNPSSTGFIWSIVCLSWWKRCKVLADFYWARREGQLTKTNRIQRGPTDIQCLPMVSPSLKSSPLAQVVYADSPSVGIDHDILPPTWCVSAAAAPWRRTATTIKHPMISTRAAMSLCVFRRSLLISCECSVWWDKGKMQSTYTYMQSRRDVQINQASDSDSSFWRIQWVLLVFPLLQGRAIMNMICNTSWVNR